MTPINREELLKLAQLSNIEIAEDELPSVLEKMNAVLNYAQRVQQLVENAGQQVPERKNKNVLREDVALVCEPEEILALAPERQGAYFVVPRIIKQT